MPASTQINFKRVILIISEGPTEKISLENILKKIYQDKRVKFQYIYGDITTKNGVSVNNIEAKIQEAIKAFIKRDKGFNKSDILKIIHLVDTDGCYIPDNKIIEDVSQSHFIYADENIIVNSRANCKSRNHGKAKILDYLITLKKIWNIDYNFYYMSTNLDHVLHNDPNILDSKKIEQASAFKEKYAGKEQNFIQDLKKEKLIYEGSFEESWDYIKQGTNSLKRKTNINLAFK